MFLYSRKDSCHDNLLIIIFHFWKKWSCTMFFISWENSLLYQWLFYGLQLITTFSKSFKFVPYNWNLILHQTNKILIISGQNFNDNGNILYFFVLSICVCERLPTQFYIKNYVKKLKSSEAQLCCRGLASMNALFRISAHIKYIQHSTKPCFSTNTSSCIHFSWFC